MAAFGLNNVKIFRKEFINGTFTFSLIQTLDQQSNSIKLSYYNNYLVMINGSNPY